MAENTTPVKPESGNGRFPAPTRMESMPDAGDREEYHVRSTQSLPTTSDTTANASPNLAASRPAPPNGRKSSQTKRPVRQSEEFDRRFDGPFGRPSLAMTRRKSSSQGAGLGSPRPTSRGRPTDVEKAEGDAANRGPTAGLGITPEPPGFLPEPPSLDYTLHTRKLSIAFFWSLIVFDSVALPIGLYFGLWYGVGPGTNTPTERKEKLSANAVFSIVTAAIGGASIIEYFLRFWRLWKKNSTCRVIGARRWYLDWFHWNYSLAWIVVMIELIVGTVPEYPPIRLLAMPVPTMLYVLSTELLIVDILRYLHVPAPVRMSSVPKGAQLRPGIYYFIEDVCAVDGSGGTEFRTALDKRYASSHIFRSMLRRLDIFWAVGGEATAVVCTILIFTIPADAAYVVGWSVPFVWAGVWSVATFWYVKRELKKERKEWNEEVAAVTSPTSPIPLESANRL